MRTRAAHVVAALTLGAATAVTGGASASAAPDDPPTCHGLPATLVGTDGDDVLTSGGKHQVVWLGPGDDHYYGGGWSDIVCGGDGDDVLSGGAGKDWLDGGAGNDRLDGGIHADRLIGGQGDDLLVGGDGWDVLVGDDVDQSLGDGSDRIYGGAGSDTIDGQLGSGADLIDGGEAEADSDYLAYWGNDRGVDIDVASGTAIGTEPGDVADHVTDVEEFGGTASADRFAGSDGHDYFQGFGGDNVISGGAGHDDLGSCSGLVRAGAGDDTFFTDYCARDGLTVHLGSGDDDAVFGNATDTTILGGAGDDRFEFSSSILDPPEWTSSAFRVDGGDGSDTLSFRYYEDFPVRIDVRSHRTTWSDNVLGFAGVDIFRGSDLGDVMIGSAHTDRFHGGPGDDVLRGGRGPDVLRGAEGQDSAFGGAGRDSCTAERRVSCEAG